MKRHTNEPRFTRLTVALAAAVISAIGPVALSSEPSSPITGTLKTVDGIRVLTVWGSNYERGYAHGYLMANDLLLFVGRVAVAVTGSPQNYEQRIIRGILPKMHFAGRYEQELEGMLAGARAKLGPSKLVVPELGRDLTVSDLKAINTVADWNSLFCSSFSVWGSLHESGEVATARNLDYLPLPGIVDLQIVTVHRVAETARQSWVGIGWTSQIGCFTGMNQHGITLSLHDCRPGTATAQSGFVPRSLALRESLEHATLDSTFSTIARVLRASPALFGNNVHCSRPYDGSTPPARIFEYDPDSNIEKGVTVRSPAINTLGPAIACTNHYRKRRPPTECPRYAAIKQFLATARHAATPIGPTQAFEILKRVGNFADGIMTVHSVYMLPNKRQIHASLATPQSNAPNAKVVLFDVGALVDAKAPQAQRSAPPSN
jgi:hypothetical protein